MRRHSVYISLALLLTVQSALAASPRGSVSKIPLRKIEADSPWMMSAGYEFSTDLAEERTPRGYDHRLMSSLGYNWNPRWTTMMSLGARTTTINGHVYKDAQQEYSEVVRPSVDLAASYKSSFFERHKFGFSLSATPLIDEVSRQEGYKGLVGGRAGVTFLFWDGIYKLGQSLGAKVMVNSFYYGSSERPNPDYYTVYDWTNSIRLGSQLTFNADFGAKLTRYLDGYMGYSYQNSVSFEWSPGNWSVGLGYENGGYTEEGRVDLWFLDEYRRIVAMSVSYEF